MSTDNNLDFDWDEDKATANLKKHQVSFEEAKSVFGDDFCVIVPDESHSDDEPREILIGISDKNRLLFVSFTELEARLIRIISARLAEGRERRKYENEKRF